MTIRALLFSLALLPCASAQAACPDITGLWVASFDSSVAGDAYVGVYKLNITPTRINASGNFSYMGEKEFDSFSSTYSYKPSCKVTFALDGGVSRFDGFAVSPEKIVFVATDTEVSASFKIVAERFDDGT